MAAGESEMVDPVSRKLLPHRHNLREEEKEERQRGKEVTALFIPFHFTVFPAVAKHISEPVKMMSLMQ